VTRQTPSGRSRPGIRPRGGAVPTDALVAEYASDALVTNSDSGSQSELSYYEPVSSSEDSSEPAGSGSQVCSEDGQLVLGQDSDDCGHEQEGGLLLRGDCSNERVCGPLGWVPGCSAGDWVSRQNPLGEQAQVVALNVVVALRRLPSHLVTTIIESLGATMKVSTPRFVQAASELLGVSASRLWRTLSKVSHNGQWAPLPTLRGMDALAADPAQIAADLSRNVMLTLTRAALAESLSGVSARQFVKHISRLAVEGVQVGDQFHTRHFVQDAQRLASKCMAAHDRCDLDKELGGLGIPSNVAVLFDGVPVGGVTLFGRHGSVLVICLGCVSAHDGRMHARFVAWAMPSSGHGGAATAETVMSALSEQPLGMDSKFLKRRMSAIGGDGAVVRGGPDRKLPGTQAADLMWFSIHPQRKPIVTDDNVLADLAGPRGRRDAWVSDADCLHTVTEWDKFHREDIALLRAITACPLAEELYAICSMMDHMFGLGDGKLLLRAAAEATQTDIRSGRMPGMTRKAVQLCSEPGNLLHNFRAYAAGLHLREAWRIAGHDLSTAKLIDAGRRLTCVQTVSFALAFRDVMGRVVAPWVNIIQSNSAEPWFVDHRWRKHEQVLANTVEVLQWFREVLRILVLLRQWVPIETLNELVGALSYARPKDIFTNLTGDAAGVCFGRRLPALFGSLGGLLHGNPPMFMGVELLCVSVRQEAEPHLIGPHCQCPFLKRRCRHGQAKMKFRGVVRPVKVPLWVAGSTHADVPVPPVSADALGADWRHPPPAAIRWRWRASELMSAPLGVPEKNRFRPRITSKQHGHDSRCTLPSSLPQVLTELDSAISGTITFVRTLLKQERLLFGTEGMSAGHARAMRAMCMCFDWGRLLCALPSASDITAFADLCQLLMPYLRHTEWPDPARFPDVRHAWPAVDSLKHQYVLLMNRLRMAKFRCPQATAGWWQTIGYRVSPVCCYDSVESVIGIAHYRAARSAGVLPEGEDEQRVYRSFCKRIASVVSQFLECGFFGALAAEQSARGSFVVSPAMLARVGYPWRNRKRPDQMRRSVADRWRVRMDPGGLATLLLPGVVGKLVHIEEVVTELDWSAVSASVDTNPYFSRDGPSRTRRSSGVSAWHAVRVHHQCRLMGSPEAVCERIGSIMKTAWNRNPSAAVSTLMDIVTLNAANVSCSGTARDEELCGNVADIMLDLGRRPIVCRKAKSARARQGIEVSRAVHNFRKDEVASLIECGRLASDAREDADDSDNDGPLDLEAVSAPPQKRRRGTGVVAGSFRCTRDITEDIHNNFVKANPTMTLPKSVHDALQKATSSKISALPVRHERRCPVASERAGSVVQSRLALWLDTDSGKQWKQQRDERVKESLA
jgi:hypothetical protein